MVFDDLQSLETGFKVDQQLQISLLYLMDQGHIDSVLKSGYFRMDWLLKVVAMKMKQTYWVRKDRIVS